MFVYYFPFEGFLKKTEIICPKKNFEITMINFSWRFITVVGQKQHGNYFEKNCLLRMFKTKIKVNKNSFCSLVCGAMKI